MVGTIWSDPTQVGDVAPSGGAVVYGGNEPRIGVITDTQTGGTFFQEIRSGAFATSSLNLAVDDPNFAYNGSLAVENDRPVTAFSNSSTSTLLRSWTGTGDIHNTSNWTNTPIFNAVGPRLAGGPAGTFLLSAPDFFQPYEVREVTGGVMGSPTRVTPGEHAARDILQDPAGGLKVAWGEGQSLLMRTSSDGVNWSSPVELATVTDAITTPDLAATSDGGGSAVFVSNTGGTRQGIIEASAFGSLAPTGQLGLGSLAAEGRGDGDADIGCSGVRFGAIEIEPQGGCLLGAVDPKFRGSKVSGARSSSTA